MRSLLKFFIFISLILTTIWLALARPFVFSWQCCEEQFLADPIALEHYTKKISTEFLPRNWNHVDNLDKLAIFIASEFSRNNSKVSFQEFSAAGSIYKNVISEYGPADSASTIVVGAHYDAFGELEAADDNASGVAGLLELGRLLSQQKLAVNVILVAYSLEEPPFFRSEQMGSAVHAESLVQSQKNISLMISLEMIGYFSEIPGSQEYPSSLLKLFYPSKGNFITIVGPFTFSPATLSLKRAFLNSVSIPVKSINAPSFIPGIDFSDHLNYWQRGFEAVMITDTAFLRNLEYHKKGDTADRLNYHKMAEVVSGVSYFLKSQS